MLGKINIQLCSIQSMLTLPSWPPGLRATRGISRTQLRAGTQWWERRGHGEGRTGKGQALPTDLYKTISVLEASSHSGIPPYLKIFRSTEQPLVPKNPHWAGLPDCFGMRLVKDRDIGTRSQHAIPWKRQGPITEPGRELDGVFAKFHSTKSRREGKDTHLPRSRRSPKGQKVGLSGWDEHLQVASSSSQDLGGST